MKRKKRSTVKKREMGSKLFIVIFAGIVFATALIIFTIVTNPQMTYEGQKADDNIFLPQDVFEPSEKTWEPPNDTQETVLVKETKVEEAHEEEVVEVVKETPQQEAPVQTIQNYSGSSFKSMGVINQNGWRYTWYSSNVLHHYRTNEWVAGNDGIYRDAEGYIVVACVGNYENGSVCYYNQGEIVPTPFGTGKIYDCGCAIGTIDIYTNF